VPCVQKGLRTAKKGYRSKHETVPYCHEEYIPEDQDMCESCFEERLLTGVVDDSEIEEEVVKEETDSEIFENDFVDIEPDIITQLPDEELDLVDTPLDLEELEVDEEILLDDEEIKEESEDYKEKKLRLRMKISH